MRLYHYLEAKWALDDIRRRRLKVSKIDDMNDPYEWKCVRSDDRRTQLALEETEREVIEKYGTLCLSRSRNDILMWSHYGDRHRGICLGFDVLEEIARVVEYVPDVRAVGDLIVENLSEFPQQQGTEIVDRLLGTKYQGWSYEQEVREHVRLSERDEEAGQYFVDFSERLQLKEAIAGVRFAMTRKPIDDALKGYSEDVRIAKARPSLTGFEIIVDESGW